MTTPVTKRLARSLSGVNVDHGDLIGFEVDPMLRRLLALPALNQVPYAIAHSIQAPPGRRRRSLQRRDLARSRDPLRAGQKMTSHRSSKS